MKNEFVELIRLASTQLPQDVLATLEKSLKQEEKNSRAAKVLEQILLNCKIAKEKSVPICQDTGTLIFYVYAPENYKQKEIETSIKKAVVETTQKSYLRPNVVSPLSEKNTGNNLGVGHPYIHYQQWEKNYLKANLILKGGGCENVGIQYALPDTTLQAGRDFNGVRKCILDAALKAQGKGCAPGCLGVCIGGDRASSYKVSKEQFFRKLHQPAKEKVLADLEKEMFEKVNSLEIGPMGFGGKTTVIGIQIGYLDRLPASYYVTISYMCWAFRRKNLTLKNGKVKYE